MARLEDKYGFAELIKSEPQTYHTILKEEYTKGMSTALFIARKKVSALYHEGHLLSFPIVGSRHGIYIFFSPKKNYTIVFRKTRDNRFESYERNNRTGVVGLTNHACYFCSCLGESRKGLVLKSARRLSISGWVDEDDVVVPYDEVVRCL